MKTVNVVNLWLSACEDGDDFVWSVRIESLDNDGTIMGSEELEYFPEELKTEALAYAVSVASRLNLCVTETGKDNTEDVCVWAPMSLVLSQAQ